MELKIFVVRREIGANEGALNELEDLKDALAIMFGGLTIIQDCQGIWHDSAKRSIENDYPVDIWLIYTDFKERTIKKALEPYLPKIKALTLQKTQLYTINHKAFFL